MHGPVAWIAFNAFVLAMLALDLGVFHRKAHAVSLREAGTWSAVWIALALAFGAGLWQFEGKKPALQYLTGYLIEKSLSVDNIFVIALIFTYFAVPAAHQHRVLFWGILAPSSCGAPSSRRARSFSRSSTSSCGSSVRSSS